MSKRVTHRDAVSADWSVLAVSLGDGWVLEVQGPSGPVEYLIESGWSADLLESWPDEALAAVGVRRSGPWEFAATSFGFRADLEPGDAA